MKILGDLVNLLSKQKWEGCLHKLDGVDVSNNSGHSTVLEDVAVQIISLHTKIIVSILKSMDRGATGFGKFTETFEQIKEYINGVPSLSIDMLVLKADLVYEGYVLMLYQGAYLEETIPEDLLKLLQNVIKCCENDNGSKLELDIQQAIPEVLHNLLLIQHKILRHKTLASSISILICFEAVRRFAQGHFGTVQSLLTFLEQFCIPPAFLDLMTFLQTVVTMMLCEPEKSCAKVGDSSIEPTPQHYLNLCQLYSKGAHSEVLTILDNVQPLIDDMDKYMQGCMFNILGACQLLKGDAKKAVVALKKSCAIFGSDSVGLIPLLNLAQSCTLFCYKEEDEVKLLKLLVQYVTNSEHSGELCEHRLYVNVEQRQVSKELSLISEFEGKYLLARRCLDLGFYADACTAYCEVYDIIVGNERGGMRPPVTKLVSMPLMFVIYHELAHCLLSTAKFSRTLAVCNEGIRKFCPKDFRTLAVRCVCRQCNNSSTDFNFTSDTSKRRSATVSRLCDFTNVIDALKALPHDVVLLTLKGKASLYLGQLSDATEAFRKVIDCLTSLVPHTSWVEESPSTKHAKHDVTDEVIDASMSEECTSPACRYLSGVKSQCWHSLAITYHGLGDVTKAMHCINMSLTYQPDSVSAAYTRTLLVMAGLGELALGASQWLQRRGVLPAATPATTHSTPSAAHIKHQLHAHTTLIRSMEEMVEIEQAVVGDPSWPLTGYGANQQIDELQVAHFNCICLRILLEKSVNKPYSGDYQSKFFTS